MNKCDDLWTHEKQKLRNINPNYREAMWLFKRFTKNLKGAVLDYGCGGNIDKPKQMPPKTLYIGCDISINAIIRMNLNGFFAFKCSETTVPIRIGKFDAVLSFDVVEHIKDDKTYIKECCRLLKPKGKLIFSTPIHTKHWSMLDEEAGHIRRYEPTEILSKIRNAGFKITKIRYSGIGLLYLLNKYRAKKSVKSYYRPQKGYNLLKFLLPLFLIERLLIMTGIGQWGYGIYIEAIKQ